MHPTLYQIHTRVFLRELSDLLGRPATFDDVGDELIAQWAADGFYIVWMMGVWRTGAAGREVSLTNLTLRESYRRSLPDCTDADVCGSPFAVERYEIHEAFGGEPAWSRFRERLHRAGIRAMLDFVPNHTAPDHPWIVEHPEYFVRGGENDLRDAPGNFVRLPGGAIYAHGRDPYFPGWSDTLQLNYRHAGLRAAMIEQLRRIARSCDGVRCDMAMLVLPEVFKRTWGDRARPSDGTPPVDAPFWPEAVAAVRREHPGFVFLSEVYWDLEAVLQQQGFDYTYDKSYYERLCSSDATSIRKHLQADAEYQRRSARFLENHDEARAAAILEPARHQAAAVLASTVPGLRMFHDGQFEGRRLRANVHLARRAEESADPVLREFYARLVRCVRRSECRDGAWRLLNVRETWAENPTWRNFVAYEWRGAEGRRSWIVVNFGPTQAQCFIEVGDAELAGRLWHLRDELGRAWYERDGNELSTRGLFVDMPAWGYHLFDVCPA